ncbi:MAG: helix-turn-helix domain-containing protein [Anaerolineae bacterium]|nr:helix-turn-helix domain-containing protein [Gloeobacterales cyanobacterium ES-bin-313]
MQNRLRQLRSRLGLSQQDLARAAGITRQTVGGIETGLYAPSAHVALRMAQALSCRVEDIFWLEELKTTLQAVCRNDAVFKAGQPLLLAAVGQRWVAHPLEGEAAFRSEMIPADAIALKDGSEIEVELLDTPERLAGTLVLAGCSPAFSLLSRLSERWSAELRVHWLFANSTRALAHLANGEVHAAGVHLIDPASGECNQGFVRRALPGLDSVLVTLGWWQEGLLVAPGNPRNLKKGADLAQPGVCIVNREAGAGCRHLLEGVLQQEGVPFQAVQGFSKQLGDHQAVARAVAAGRSDGAVSTEAIAKIYSLDFVPWRRVRFDLAIPRAYLTSPPMQRLIDALQNSQVRRQLQQLAGYDTRQTGEIVTEGAGSEP